MENQSSQGSFLTRKQRRELRRQEKLQRREEEQTRSKRNRTISWLVVSILVLGSVGGIIFLTKEKPGTAEELGEIPAISDQDVVLGNRSAEVSIIEYGDYQCPACQASDPVVRQVVLEYGEKAVFSFRHFPLRTIHKNGQMASQAAEAAGKQDAYWKMHEMLFDRQKDWSTVSNAEEVFLGYAGELGLDQERFKQDIASDEVRDAVNVDYDSGVAAGINSTPTFYLNRERIDNPSSAEEWKKLIDPLLSGGETGNINNTPAEQTPANESSE